MDIKLLGDEFHLNGDYLNSVSCYSLALGLNFEDKHILYLNRGLGYIKMKQYELAFNDISTAIKLKPNYAKSWGRLGSILQLQGKKEQAIKAYEKAYKLDPKNEIFKKLSNHNGEETDTEDEEETINKKIDELKILAKKFKEDKTPLEIVNIMFKKMVLDKSLITRILDSDFQKKIDNCRNNPVNGLKDAELLAILKNILN